LLSSEPYGYGSVVVGLFGLIGIVVILAAPVYSRLVIDKMVPLVSAVMGLSVELVGVVVGTFTGSTCVAGPVVQAITIDLGSQFTQIANRAAIYGIQPQAQNRVNTAYMVAAFSGQLTGTAIGNRLYAQGGWMYSGSCSSRLIPYYWRFCILAHFVTSRVYRACPDSVSCPGPEGDWVVWMVWGMDHPSRSFGTERLGGSGIGSLIKDNSVLNSPRYIMPYYAVSTPIDVLA
jgi:hypothetical protein